jgi:hypothetical protein
MALSISLQAKKSFSCLKHATVGKRGRLFDYFGELALRVAQKLMFR